MAASSQRAGVKLRSHVRPVQAGRVRLDAGL